MPAVEDEKAVQGATMEITVSRQDLLRELTATQRPDLTASGKTLTPKTHEGQVHTIARSRLPDHPNVHTNRFSLHPKVLFPFHFGHGFAACGNTRQL
jgi:hypothetical protein